MSEEVTKSAEEILADVVKSEVAHVAEAIEAVKSEIPSVEGFVKSEETAEMAETIKSLKEEIAAEKAAREELDAVVKSAPAIVKGDVEMAETWKWDAEGFNAKSEIDMGGMITKAYDTTTQVTGEPESTARLYYALQQMNPFRGLSTVMPMNSSTMNLPEVTAITAAHEGTVPAEINTGTGHGGSLASVELVTRNWVSRTAFSDQSVEDLPGLDSMVGGFMGQQIGVAEATDMVAQIKASVNAAGFGNRVTTTGGAITFENLLDMKAGLSSAYMPSSVWMFSRETWSNVRALDTGAGGELLWDAGIGDFTLLGHRVVINDHLEDFGAANNLIALFGDFSRGTVIGNRKSMSISRHADTIPGAVYYYGNMRSRGQLWDDNAVFALRANA